MTSSGFLKYVDGGNRSFDRRMSVISITGHSPADESLDPGSLQPDPVEQRRKRILKTFSTLLAVGLALAAWYIVARIVSVRKVQAAAAKVVNTATVTQNVLTTPIVVTPPVATAPPVEAPKVSAKPAQTAPREIDPQPGQTYLQLAAYGPRALAAYLATLQEQGLHPSVAPGPSPDVFRILIGPFPNTDALERARVIVQSVGIEPIVRTY